MWWRRQIWFLLINTIIIRYSKNSLSYLAQTINDARERKDKFILLDKYLFQIEQNTFIEESDGGT